MAVLILDRKKLNILLIFLIFLAGLLYLDIAWLEAVLRIWSVTAAGGANHRGPKGIRVRLT